MTVGVARAIRRVVRDAKGCLLDYATTLDTQNGEEVLHAKRVNATGRAPTIVRPPSDSVTFLRVSTDTFLRAKDVANGLDVYVLHEQWRKACEVSGERIRNPDAAYLAYCRAAAERSPARRVS
ncbi:MAG: hypothetical protein KDC95_18300 [Planctomycetes bacterium]|nr:hypothetical protein [Planctomycetota bacterium]